MSMETVTRLRTQLPGLEIGGALPAVADLQARALDLHLRQPMPDAKDEEWRYTPLRALREGTFALGSTAPAEAVPLAGLDQVRLTFVNGVYEAGLSTGSAEGLEVMPLETALADPAIASKLGQLAALEERAFHVSAHRGSLRRPALGALAALNTAAFRSGAFLRVAKGARIAPVVHLAFLSTGADGPTAVNFPRTLVLADEGCRFELLETYASIGDGPAYTNAVTEVFAGPGAHLEHVKLQIENEATLHTGHTEVLQERDSTYLGFAVTYGGHTTRNDLNVFLNGQNLHSRIDGVVCLDGHQHADNHTRLDHAHPNCDSFEVYKHVLAGRSTAVFNGKIFVHQDAQKTDAKQTNQALLLSRDATMDTKPQLEIFADDVKCTHGATVGQLRQDALFYLRSRGLGEAQARAILVYAFAAEVLEKIRHEGIREALEAMLYAKLGVE
jgi:Fe-S cluster assembly protein SufD